jgi:hypothetical protein
MPAPPIIPMKNAGKGKQDEEETVRNRKRKRKQGDDSEAYQSRYDLTAEQQVMCNTMPIEAMLTCQLSRRRGHLEAVRVDGTIIVLHSGNHELVCVRHRESQTLYVSDLIEPPMCKDAGYGKLRVSIYVAAIQDMMDRTKQRLQRSQPKSPDGDDGDDKDDPDDNWGSGSGHMGDQRNSKTGREMWIYLRSKQRYVAALCASPRLHTPHCWPQGPLVLFRVGDSALDSVVRFSTLKIP